MVLLQQRGAGCALPERRAEGRDEERDAEVEETSLGMECVLLRKREEGGVSTLVRTDSLLRRRRGGGGTNSVLPSEDEGMVLRVILV